MAFDKTAWDPTPSQYTALGMVFAWVTAMVVEFFLFGQSDASDCVQKILSSAFHVRFDSDFWNPLVLWFLVPFAAFYVPMKFLKKYRKRILLAMTATYTLVLILVDLKVKLF